MRVVKTIFELKQIIAQQKSEGRIIGLVPTMGALHQGHISLVDEAAKTCDFIVVSIFVNPTQFNNADDLKRYPRVLDKDLELLKSTPCKLVFAPEVNEVYPERDTRKFDFGTLESVMEGFHRPGHFNGVGQIVSKLFDITQPHKAYFGLKDFQQLAIIRSLVHQYKIPVEIVECPIIREADGLALSSRNMLLTTENRKNAPIIAHSLIESCNFALEREVADVEKYVVESVNKTQGLEVEYFEIVNGHTLQKVNNWLDSDYIVGCIAVYAGKIRLIDNIIYKNYHHAH